MKEVQKLGAVVLAAILLSSVLVVATTSMPSLQWVMAKSKSSDSGGSSDSGSDQGNGDSGDKGSGSGDNDHDGDTAAKDNDNDKAEDQPTSDGNEDTGTTDKPVTTPETTIQPTTDKQQLTPTPTQLTPTPTQLTPTPEKLTPTPTGQPPFKVTIPEHGWVKDPKTGQWKWTGGPTTDFERGPPGTHDRPHIGFPPHRVLPPLIIKIINDIHVKKIVHHSDHSGSSGPSTEEITLMKFVWTNGIKRGEYPEIDKVLDPYFTTTK